MRKFILLGLFLLTWQFSSFAQRERIINYHTDIEVQLDRSIIVTETIEVYAAGNIIKRGITRDLPTNRSFNNKNVRVKYKILEIRKDGVEEPYHKEFNGGKLTLFLGEKDVFLKPGQAVYKIKYRVPNQIAFYDDFDEIYWNAIGQDIQFDVEKATCAVRLPTGVEIIQKDAYMGSYGTKGKEFQTIVNENVINYKLDRSLRPREGFTIAIGFEKGHIAAPNIFQRFGSLIIILLGLLILLPYYIQTWLKFGQDPPTPAAYPIWESPDELSSASIGYIRSGGYRSSGFTASIIDLAIKGYVKIEEQSSKGFFSASKTFDLVKLKELDDHLPEEEKELFRNMFSGKNRVSLDGKYDTAIKNTYDQHSSSLAYQHRDFIHEGDNTRLLWLPIAITVIVGVLAVILLINSSYAEGVNLITLLIFSPVAIIGFLLYTYLIKKPSVEKLELRSRIQGYKMYLEMAEKDRLKLLNPPELTPEVFEEALPFAFALGVEHQWSEKFKTILEQAQYRPEWHNSPSPIYFSNHFGRDFSQVLTGSRTQPTSSGSGSGSGGGGFSGGGGGGGGVGGW